MMTFQPTTSTIIKSSTSLFMSDAALSLTNGKEGVYYLLFLLDFPPYVTRVMSLFYAMHCIYEQYFSSIIIH